MIPIPDKPLIELLDEVCEQYKDRVCLRQNDDEMTYAEVAERSVAVANALVAAGLQKGFRGAVLTPNDMYSVPVIIGIIRAGGVWIPVNPRNSIEDNKKLLTRFGCDALVVHSFFERHVPILTEALPDLRVTVGLDKAFLSLPAMDVWAAAAPPADEFPTADAGDLVFMPTTGGTTGVPKAVGLSNRNFVAVLASFKEMNAAVTPVYLSAAPMTHVGGRIVFCMMYCGGSSVVLQGVDPQEVLQTIQQEKITNVFLPPSGIYALLDQPNVRDFDYSSLKSIGYGSAPMSIDRLKEALNVFGPVMQGGFGQTECPMMIAWLPPAEHFIDGKIAPDTRLRSCGRATPISELGIMDEDGELLAAGERGEIAVKGPMAMEGYVDDPTETAKVRRNGWHLTGDIGYLDEDGYLYIVDRKKDMIVTGGFNVYSAEVEGVISTIDGVVECAVIGVPDERWGEAVKAIVRQGKDANLTEELIIQTCKEKIGSVKAPKSVEFVDDFPRTSIGKLMKKAVREKYWQGHERKV